MKKTFKILLLMTVLFFLTSCTAGRQYLTDNNNSQNVLARIINNSGLPVKYSFQNAMNIEHNRNPIDTQNLDNNANPNLRFEYNILKETLGNGEETVISVLKNSFVIIEYTYESKKIRKSIELDNHKRIVITTGNILENEVEEAEEVIMN